MLNQSRLLIGNGSLYITKSLFLLPTMEQRSTDSNVDSHTVAGEEFENQDSDVCLKPSNLQPKSNTTKREKMTSVTFEEALLNTLQKQLTEDENFHAKIQILNLLEQIKQNRATNQFMPNYSHIPHNFLRQQNMPTPMFTPLHHTNSLYTDTR